MGWVREESNPNVGRNDLKRGEEKEKRKKQARGEGRNCWFSQRHHDTRSEECGYL